MYWINIKGKFATDNPQLFIDNLKYLMNQTKTSFSGEMTQQLIKDVICEKWEIVSENTDENIEQNT
jgi:hypothetical protein